VVLKKFDLVAEKKWWLMIKNYSWDLELCMVIFR